MRKTTINTKEFIIRSRKLETEDNPKVLKKYIDEMFEIIESEIENAKESISCLKLDSRLGWEPSMEYIGAPDRIEWKEKLETYIMYGELTWYRKGIELDLKEADS